MRPALRGIYLIVDEGGRDPVTIANAALRAGVRIVQYRAKKGLVPESVHALRKLTLSHNALLIMNDDWRAALAFECDGVHLGPEDGGFAEIASVRSFMGDRLIGLSCGTVAEASAVDASLVNYLGVGPVFVTASKADAGNPIGVDGLLAIARATTLPVAAIGGIDRGNLNAVRASGVAMAAVISAISNAPTPAVSAMALVAAWG